MKHSKPQSKEKPAGSKTTASKKNPLKKNPAKDLQAPLKRWLGLIVATVGLILYIQTSSYQFVLDDYSLIKENKLTMQGFKGIPEIMKSSYRSGYIIIDDEVYRPLSKVMFAMEWGLFGDNPAPGHFINILLYAFIGYFLFITLCRYFPGQLTVPFIASLLFISHPIHTEVVANIKSRDELLGFLFTIASMYTLYTYIIDQKAKSLILSAGFFFLALLSKESYITYVALVPLLIYFFSDTPVSKNIRASVVMFTPAILYLLIRRTVLGTSLPASQSIADNLLVAAPDISSRLATAIQIMGIYLKLLFFPHPLIFDYSYKQIPIITVSDWRFWASFLAYLTLFIYALMRFKKKDLLSFSILLYFIFLSIYTNLFLLIGSSFGERFLFAPALGFCIAVAILFGRIFNNPLENTLFTPSEFFKLQGKAIGAAAVIVILFGYKTIARNPVWKSNLALYSNDVFLAPNSTRTHYYLGNLFTKDDYYKDLDSAGKSMMLDSAINELQRSVDIYPKFTDAFNQMGVAYYRKKNYQKAFEKYQLALNANPTDATVHNNMGTVLFETGQYQEAINAFSKAIQYNPNYAEAYANLGSGYGMLKQYDNAINYLSKAVKSDPNYAQAYFFLGITYRFKGDEASAQQYINKAYALDPSLKK